ncbi:glycosyltransferase [Croceivirga thetidis]|uniref:Colanic acid biosynthesis glycosyltransferase WcaL n=1 Tax=Croceivirga thetidis TaxID=2721623 RepID=A0ABX1GSR5_9FLAO|nr:glycosyltransferase [Croceivirga thetidis]NKI32046.1 colanic acid biosynthesis glycosyltransferase WcaL [Croceivirga thetidis]
MNILHLERKFPGSTETFIVNQINMLPKYEHSVFTIDFIDELKSIAKVYHPPKKNILSAKVMLANEVAFFKEKIEAINPDIIHGHFITDACVFRPVTKKMNVPKICSCYGYDVSVIPVKFKHFYKFFYKPIIAEYDLFLAMTDEMQKDLLEMGFPEEKVTVHYHGVDTQKFSLPRIYKANISKLNILTVASLLEVKGHETVLRALAHAKQNQDDFQFEYDIVGQGALKDYLVNLAKSLDISDFVRFHGAISHGDEFMQLLKKADVFAHPSVTTKDNDKEGIPGAIVEAMASGLPVIATEHGGIPYVVTDSKNGFLIKEKDYQTMAGLFYKLFSDPNIRSTIGKSAQEYALEHLDLLKKSKDLERIYESLITKQNH